MKINEAFRSYIEEEIVAAGLSNKTLESYENCKKLATRFFNKEIGEISAVDVRGFYKWLMTWQAPDTARGNIICLRAVIRLLNRKGARTTVHYDDIKVPKRQKRTIHFLNNSEAEEFIAIIGEHRRGYSELNRLRNVAIAKVLYSSGIRVSELCRLNRDSIIGRQFTVIGKSKEPRICFISEDAEAAVNEYLTMRQDHERALFVSGHTGERVTSATVRAAFKFACNRSRFEHVHPHTLRHSFATSMLESGVDVFYIGQFLGHQSLDITREYLHYSNPKLREVYCGYEKSLKTT